MAAQADEQRDLLNLKLLEEQERRQAEQELAELEAQEYEAAQSEELQRMAGEIASPTEQPISEMLGESDAEPTSVFGQAMEYLSRPAAATRAAIAAETGKRAEAFKQAIQLPSQVAMTGSELAQVANVPAKPFPGTGVSPADIAGMGIEAFADPTMLVPFEKAAAIPARAGLAAGKTIGRAAGSAVEKIAPAMSRATENFAKSLSPDLAYDFGKKIELAKAHNIDLNLLPYSVKYGEPSLIEKVRKTRAQLGIGDDFAAHEKGLRQVDNALSTEISRIGGNIPVPSKEQAGNAIIEGYRAGVRRLFDENKVRYSTIVDKIGEDRLADAQRVRLLEKLDGLIENVDEQLSVALSERRPQLQTTRSDLTKIFDYVYSQDDEPVSMKLFIAQMQELGKTAYSEPKFFLGAPSSDRQVLKTAYDAMRTALIDSVGAIGGPDAQRALEQANKAQSQFFNQNKYLERIFNNPKISPDKAYDALFLSGSSNQLGALKAIVGENSPALQEAKAYYLDSLLSRSADGNILHGSTLKRIENSDRDFLIRQKFFRPEETKDFDDLLRLGREFGSPIANPSGTAVAQLAWQGAKSPIRTAIGLAGQEALIARAEKQAALKLARQQAGKLTPEVAQDIAKQVVIGSNPERAILDIQNFLMNSTEQTGIGLSLAPTKTEIAAKTLFILDKVKRNQPGFGPVMVPIDLRDEMIRQIMTDDSFSPIQKARNKFNLETNGYLVEFSPNLSVPEGKERVAAEAAVRPKASLWSGNKFSEEAIKALPKARSQGIIPRAVYPAIEEE